MEDNFGRVRDKIVLDAGFLLMGDPLYSMEDFAYLINILIDM